jgi:outer membrane protein OmpA-like peptidoglycan-associated protein
VTILAAIAWAGLAATPVWAQAPVTDSVDSMVRQLQPPRTRSLRNLVPEPAPAAADPAQQAAPRPAPEPAPSLSLLVQFDFDSAVLRSESVPLLERLARALQDPSLAQSRFAVEGHTDANGRADYNQRLSGRRAASVKDLLVQLGIPPGRLVAVGKGSSEPANTSDPLAPENRRVRVVNLH